MRSRDPELLMRYVSEQMEEPARRDLEQRLLLEPDLRRALQELEHTWSSLTPPEMDESPDDSLATTIMTRVRGEARLGQDSLHWSTAPLWAKTGSVVSLAVGMTMGVLMALPGAGSPVEGDRSLGGETSESSFLDPEEPTLADAYWQAMEASGGRLEDEVEDDRS